MILRLQDLVQKVHLDHRRNTMILLAIQGYQKGRRVDQDTRESLT